MTLHDALSKGVVGRILGASRMIGATGLAIICEGIVTADRACDLNAIQFNYNPIDPVGATK